MCPMHKNAAANQNQGAIRLNGFVWGLIIGLALAVAGTRHTVALLPVCVLLNLVVALGLCANGALLLWKLFTGRLRQVAGYILGGALLAVLLVELNQEATLRYLRFLPASPVTR